MIALTVTVSVNLELVLLSLVVLIVLFCSGARFSKEVQPTLSLNLNSELTYSEMGNSEFSVTEQLNCVSLLNSK